jgi:predicted permease
MHLWQLARWHPPCIAIARMLTEIRIALRTLGRSPGFTVVAVLVLGLAIGGVTAMFTVVNAVALRPVLADRPGELVRLYLRENKPDPAYQGFSYPDYVDLREQNPSFSSLASSAFALVGLQEGDLTRRSFAALVSANYFSTMGVQLKAGRSFSLEEEQAGSGIPVTIVSHSYWRRTGADPGLVGRTIRINSRIMEVVGIAPEGFTGTTALLSPEFWLPLGMYEQVVNDFANLQRQELRDRGHHPLFVFGRLKRGTTMAQAQAPMEALAQQLTTARPDATRDHIIELGTLPRFSTSTYRQEETWPRTVSLLLMGMAGVVMLVACLNLANMLLARGATRRKEMAIRLSLGASRLQIVKQLLMEGLILSALGGVAGLLLAGWSSRLLMASLAPRVPFISIVFDPRPDMHILLITALVCGVSTLLFALLPACRLARTDVPGNLKSHSDAAHSKGPSAALFSWRNALVIGQIALSLGLLTAGSLFLRGTFKALQADPGFSLDHGIIVEVDAALAGYGEAHGRQLYPAVVERLRKLPGIEAASFAYIVPFGIVSDGKTVSPAGSATEFDGSKSAKDEAVYAGFNVVGIDYFKTIGLPLLRGRDFERVEIESTNAPPVAIIDQPLAERLWPGQDPVGRFLRFHERSNGELPLPLQVVGVVGGVRNELGDKELKPHIYVPFGQHYRSMMNLHLRAPQLNRNTEAGLLTAVRQTIHTVDERLPVISIQTLRRYHADGIFIWILRTGAQLFAWSGGLAVLLALVGLYSVKAYLVASRTREIGIRMALGAQPHTVLWMVLREGLKVSAVGISLGLLLAIGVGMLLRGLLYDIQAIDPWTFAIVPTLLVVATLLASYLPARRALRIDPLTALRCE